MTDVDCVTKMVNRFVLRGSTLKYTIENSLMDSIANLLFSTWFLDKTILELIPGSFRT
ncbi:MAG: hypothetical protein SCALA701_09170 [Candidatus Scalindua sp.]|nr:MAG: hypothetical protein SCALA701_09170 [Candidatus Scalindua sp.]